MSKGAKQAWQLLLITLAFVALGAWCAQVGSKPVIWTLRVAAPVGVVIVSFLLWKFSRRPDRLPDLLRDTVGRYFEQSGLCFAPRLEVLSGHCFICLYFQNRHAGEAVARVQFLPPLRSFSVGRHPLPQVTYDLACPGGAFGVVRVPFPVPRKYQGTRVQYEVGADVEYPQGRGKLLRYAEGVRVGRTRHLSQAYQLLETVVGLFFGFLSVSGPSRAPLQLPTEVLETGPDFFIPSPQILWQPDQPAAPPTPLRQAA